MVGIETKDLFMLKVVSIEGLKQGSQSVMIRLSNGSYIEQDSGYDEYCDACIRIDQINGEVSKHIGATILKLDEKIVEDVASTNEPATAIFYTLQTSKGYLDWRWSGESDGWYSETVNCKLIKGQ